jgi:hypothetical protein
MPRPWDVARAERALREGGGSLQEVLRALPNDETIADLAADRVVELCADIRFTRTCRNLPPLVVERVLERFAVHRDRTWLTFIRAYVAGAEDLGAAWRDALEAVADLNTSYSIGSAKHRAKLEKLAADPRSIEAARAAAASRSSDVPWSILELLARDGEEGSLDALLPTLDRGLTTRDGVLDQLAGLKKWARRDAARLHAFLDQAIAAKSERSDASPVMAIVRRLFPAHRGHFRLLLFTGSRERDPGGIPLYRLCLEIDSRTSRPFDLSITRPTGEATRFDLENARDDLGLGTCAPIDVPAYLEGAAERLAIAWSWPGATITTSLRGRQRTELIAWLSAPEKR